MPEKSILWATMAFLAAPLAILSEKRFRSLPTIADGPLDCTSVDQLPSLSIVVPARNEASNLPRLLGSLQAIDYPGPWEMIVVDDDSSDDTANLAQKYGARVICLDHLPKGWLGKPYACHRGAMAATGEWLLFTDADTFHDPCGPARAVGLARDNGLDGLSAFVRQETSGPIDRLGLLTAYGGLFLTLNPKRGLLNGQYILMRRQIYEASGGFRVVSGERIEDVALGHHLQANGCRVPIYRGDELATVRMYADKHSLWHGLSRLGSGTLSWLGLGAAVTGLFITGAMSPLLALAAALQKGRQFKLAVLSWLAVSGGFVPWARRFGSSWLALLAPFGALLIQAASVWGLLSRLTGRGARWKDRNI